MPKGAGKDEEPGADPDEEKAAGTPHADIVRDAPFSMDVEPDPAEPSAKVRAAGAAAAGRSRTRAPSARRGGFGTARPGQLQERIARLDETLARISRCSRSYEVETTVSRSHDDSA
jgi:hypothetical protein